MRTSIINIEDLWTPAQLPAGTLSLWLDASDLSTITVATGVSQWRDKSGSNNHANQSNIANQPQFLSNGLQGKPSIRFLPDTSSSTTGDKLTITHTNSLIFDNYIIAAVIDNDGASGSGPGGIRAFIEKANSSGSTDRKLLIANRTGNSFFITAENNSILMDNVGLVIETAQIVLFAKPPTPSIGPAVFRQNGSQVSSDATFTNSNNTSDINIGGSFYPWNGLISEVILVRISDTNNIQLVEGYLAWKWGLQNSLNGSHPFVSRPPSTGD